MFVVLPSAGGTATVESKAEIVATAGAEAVKLIMTSTQQPN